MSVLLALSCFAGCSFVIGNYPYQTLKTEKTLEEKYFNDIDTENIITDKTSSMYDIKSIPSKATLYEDNDIKELSPLDKKVVAALNIFQTSLLLENYMISQGLANTEYNAEKNNERLEILFDDKQGFDKIVIIEKSFYVVYDNYEYTSLYGYDDDYGVFEIIPYGEKFNEKEFSSLNWLHVFDNIVNGTNVAVRIIDSESFLHDFTVVDDKVEYKCSVTVMNTTDKEVQFTLSARADDSDVVSGLLKTTALTDSSGTVYKLGSGEKKTFDVVFTGEGMGGKEKFNRLPPKIMLNIKE